MTQVQVAVSLTAFGSAPRPATAMVIDCPACHGTFALAVPDHTS